MESLADWFLTGYKQLKRTHLIIVRYGNELADCRERAAFFKQKIIMNIEKLQLELETFCNILSCKKEKVSITVESIINTVCDYYNLDAEEIQENTRKRKISQARQIAMELSSKLTKKNQTQIGQMIGNRHRTSVIHAAKTVNDLYATNKEFRNDYDYILRLLV